jgi:hypothetical protein
MSIEVCGKHSIAEILKDMCYSDNYPEKLEFTALSKETDSVCAICLENAQFSFKIQYKEIQTWRTTKELSEL